jgi:predicted dehydrogenase
VDSDDFTSLLVHFVDGAEGVICLSSVARHARGNRVEVYGNEGSLALDADNRLWGARVGEKDFEEFTVPDPLVSMDTIAPNVWTRSFAHLARHMIDTIRSGGQVRQGATFLDGLRCQAVLDAAKQSWDEERWVEIGVAAD